MLSICHRVGPEYLLYNCHPQPVQGVQIVQGNVQKICCHDGDLATVLFGFPTRGQY